MEASTHIDAGGVKRALVGHDVCFSWKGRTVASSKKLAATAGNGDRDSDCQSHAAGSRDQGICQGNHKEDPRLETDKRMAGTGKL